MKEFLKWVVRADTASSQKIVAVLKAKTENRESQKTATLFVATDDPLLEKAGTEQIGQVLKASMAVQKYAADDVCGTK